MFNELNQGSQAVDDIFAETDKGGSAAPNIETQPAGLSAQSYGEPEQGKGGGSKTKLILIIALGVLIIGAAAYLVYSKFMQPSEELPLVTEQEQATSQGGQKATNTVPVVEDDVIVPEADDEAPISTSTPAGGVDATTTVETPIVTAPVDSDGDSLLDSEEDALGTNSSLIDSDFDGLSDYEETKVYGTNPANPDTDSDTFKDGDEVKNGYNPKGEGKL